MKNTMSDRANTEKLFNLMLLDYRRELLPQVIEGFEEMSKEEKAKLAHMNNFFCVLLLLKSLQVKHEVAIARAATYSAKTKQITALKNGLDYDVSTNAVYYMMDRQIFKTSLNFYCLKKST